MERETPVAILREERETGRDTVEYTQRASAGSILPVGFSLFPRV